MAFQASLALFVRDSDAQNACNYNDHLQQINQTGHWKPRFAGWPLGGETRKRAHTRCVTGAPGSARSTSSNSGLMLASNLGARYVDPDAAIFDKQVDLKEDLRARFSRWSVNHLPGGESSQTDVSPSARPAVAVAGAAGAAAAVAASARPPRSVSTPPAAAAASPSPPQPVYGGAWTQPRQERTRGTQSWRLSRLPALPKPVFFANVAKGASLLAAGRVPMVRREAEESKKRFVAHTRPYEKPWLGPAAEPVIYFEA